MQSLSVFFLLFAAFAARVPAQTPSSGQSSSSSSTPAPNRAGPVRSRAGQPEAGGAAITLETSESLFDVATALNACGYDAGLANSLPVRAQVRADVNAALADSSLARQSRDTLCGYVREHELSNPGRALAQYISLALYLSPPPELKPVAEQTDMPPDALGVVNILPLLRDFADKVSLHSLWLKHRPEYTEIVDRVHDPMTRMILNTNVYLKVPVSSYDGRRLLILIEPMLSPNTPNARIYASDYDIVTSPDLAGTVKLDQIRHLYLQYVLDPLVYARAQSITRLTPLLKPVQEAPIEFLFKSDVVALVTECMIKAIEARTLDTGPAPVKPAGSRARVDLARYDEEMSSYDRQAEALRRKQVDLDMRQGWVLTDYFYGQFALLEHNPEGLSESMGEMVYGMDVDRVRHQAEQIQFLPQGSTDFVTRVRPAPTGLMLAEKKLLEGDLDGAELLADRSLADPHQDHGDAMFVKARIELLQSDPKDALEQFEEVVHTAHNPHTLAWAHVYLGRLYDTKEPTERQHALTEYHAALSVPGITPDAKAAAETGLKTPYAVPKIAREREEEEPLDPTGKKEKESYKPDPPLF